MSASSSSAPTRWRRGRDEVEELELGLADRVGQRQRRRAAPRRSTSPVSSRRTPSALPALPCGSTSTSSVRRSEAASEAARFTAVVVLPTPPFWFATVRIRLDGPCSGGGAAPDQLVVQGESLGRSPADGGRRVRKMPDTPDRCSTWNRWPVPGRAGGCSTWNTGTGPALPGLQGRAGAAWCTAPQARADPAAASAARGRAPARGVPRRSAGARVRPLGPAPPSGPPPAGHRDREP